MRGWLSVLRMEFLLLRRGAFWPLVVYALLIALLRERDIGHVVIRDGLRAPMLLASTGVTFAVVIGQLVIQPARWTLPLLCGHLLAVRLAGWALVGAAVLVPLMARPERYGWTGFVAAVSAACSGVAAGALYVAITPSSGWKRPETTVFTLLPILIGQVVFWSIESGAGRADSRETAARMAGLAIILGGIAVLRDSRRECAPAGRATAPAAPVSGKVLRGRQPRRVLVSIVWGGGGAWAVILLCVLATWGYCIRMNGGLGVGPIWNFFIRSWWLLGLLLVNGTSTLIGRAHPGESFLDAMPVSRRTVFRLRTGPKLAVFLAFAAVITADAGNRSYPSMAMEERDALTFARGEHLTRIGGPFAEVRTPEELAERVVNRIEERQGVVVERAPVEAAARGAWYHHPSVPPDEGRSFAITAALEAIDPVVLPSLRRASRERTLLIWILTIGIVSTMSRLSLSRGPGDRPSERHRWAALALALLAGAAALAAMGLFSHGVAAGLTAGGLALARVFQAYWPLWTGAWAVGMVLLWRSSEKAWLRFDAEDRGLLNRATTEVI